MNQELINRIFLMVFVSFSAFCLMPVILELADRRMWKRRRSSVEKQTMGGYRLWEV